MTVLDTPGLLNCDESNAHVEQEVLRAALFIFTTADKTPIPSQPVAPSAPSNEIVTNMEVDVPQSETFWEMLNGILNNDNRGKVYFFGLVPLLFLKRKLMKT